VNKRWLMAVCVLIILACSVTARGIAGPETATPSVSAVLPATAAEALAGEAQASAAQGFRTDRELETYELTAVAVGMRLARTKARADAIASTSLDPADAVDPEAERKALDGLVSSHAEPVLPAKSRTRLESARLDQKLIQSKRQIALSKTASLEAKARQLGQELSSAELELGECTRLLEEHRKRLQALEAGGAAALSRELVIRKKSLLDELITTREEYLRQLQRLAAGAKNRLAAVDDRAKALREVIARYEEFDGKIGLLIRRHEETVRRQTMETEAQAAQEAADAARREIEALDRKLQDVDRDLAEESVASASSVATKLLLVSKRELLLSQKDALAEQARHHDLRGRAARDTALFEEIEQQVETARTGSGTIVALGRTEWLPRLDQALTEYQNEKALVAKRIELLGSTRLIVEQALAEAEKAGGRAGAALAAARDEARLRRPVALLPLFVIKHLAAARDEARLRRQQLGHLQAALQALNEQNARYDALIRQAFSVKQTIQSAIDAEQDRRLFARSRFRPRPGLVRAIIADVGAVPAGILERLAATGRQLSTGLAAQLLLTLLICFGIGRTLHGMRVTAPDPERDHATITEWVKGNAVFLATTAALVAVSRQAEPLIPLFDVPAAFLASWLAYSLIERTLLRRLHENHILRLSLTGIARVMAVGIPVIALLRSFGTYPELVFLVRLACKLLILWPMIRFIRAAAAFSGLLQAYFGLKQESRLLRIAVLAYKFIAILNLVCLLTSLYGYGNLAAFVFIRNMEVFVIVLMITISKPVSERIADRLFDPATGVATPHVTPERAQFLSFLSRKLIRLAVYLFAALSAASMAGITTSTPAVRFMIDWVSGQSDWLFARIGRIAIIAAAIALVLEFVQTLGESVIAYVKNEDRSSLTENERRASTLVQIVNTSARVVLFCIGGIMILRELGMDITPLLTGAGIVGVAIGFGSQSLVKDFFAGFFILVENQFRVGDVVEIAGRAGAVEKINLKTTVLRASDGSVFIIPNGEITAVKNMTYTWSRAVLDIGVSYETDLDRAIEILQRIGDELASDARHAADIWGRPEVLGVENLDSSSVVLRMLVKTRPLTQWEIARVFRKRIKQAFDEEGIEIPFPQRVVTLRVDEDMKHLLRGLGSKDV